MIKKLYILFVILLTSSLSIFSQTYTLQPGAEEGKDCEIWSYSQSSAQRGDTQSMNVYTWTYNGIKTTKRALIEFDLSTFSSDMNLLKASLSLYYNPDDPYESVEEHSGENEIFIERVSDAWEENTVLWNNQPSTTSENRIEFSKSKNARQNYLDIDVTQLVQNMLDDPENSHGFMVKMQNEEDPYRMIILATSDHPESSYHPKLVLEFKKTIAIPGIEDLDDMTKQEQQYLQEGQEGPIEIEEQDQDDTIEIIIFPNPIIRGRNLVIAFQSPVRQTNDISYNLYDALGRKILSGKIKYQREELSSDLLESGMYFLNVYDNKGNETTKKIVVVQG